MTTNEAYGNFASKGWHRPPADLIAAPTGTRKSTTARAKAVEFVNKHPGYSIVILMDRNELSSEQLKLLAQEHPNGNYAAAIWRGRWAWDPEIGDGFQEYMCQRPEAKLLEMAALSVEHNLCKQGRGDKEVKCSLYEYCGYQRQKLRLANIWFAAHECMIHELPKVMGKIGWIIIDENPLDARMFGVENDKDLEKKPYELALDKLASAALPMQLSEVEAELLRHDRKQLYQILAALKVPRDQHKGVPVAKEDLRGFFGDGSARRNVGFEWRGKIEPEIRPDMSKEEIEARLKEASGNATVAKLVRLWELVSVASSGWGGDENELCGRIQVHDSEDGRMIRMVGLEPLAKGWDTAAVVILDATGDVELLRAPWPQLQANPYLPIERPEEVEIYQLVDKSISKMMVAVEGKTTEQIKRQRAAARRAYAAVLVKALKHYGGDISAALDNATGDIDPAVAVITYKSTEEMLRGGCCIPRWLGLAHYGDVTGTNKFGDVRAQFEVGRQLPPAESVSRMIEALTGEYVAERDYKLVEGGGVIRIDPPDGKYNAIAVDVWKHPHPLGERLRRMICEGGLIQAEGRARASLRGVSKKLLTIWRFTDTPLPELGPVIPVLWDDVAVGLDGLMLAVGGVWLENAADAERIYGDEAVYGDKILTATALWKERQRRGQDFELINDTSNPALVHARYRRAGERTSTSRAVFVAGGIADHRGWLETKLGPLATFEQA